MPARTIARGGLALRSLADHLASLASERRRGLGRMRGRQALLISLVVSLIFVSVGIPSAGATPTTSVRRTSTTGG